MAQYGKNGSVSSFTDGKIGDSNFCLEMVAMNIGQAIRLCRTQRGVSQTDIAQKASCSVSYLSMLENNKRDPTLSTLTRIAQALHVPIGLLFVLAAEQGDLDFLDKKLAGALAQSAFASLGVEVGSIRKGGHHG